MITYIKIGGKRRPIAFGYQVSYDYEINTGRNYNALLVAVSDMFARSATAMTGNESDADAQEIEDVAQFMSDERRKAVTEFSVVPLTDLVFYGMLYAHRKERIEVDFEAADVADWIFSDREAMTACLRLLMDASPAKANDDDAAAKKNGMGPSKASIGKGSSRRRQ